VELHPRLFELGRRRILFILGSLAPAIAGLAVIFDSLNYERFEPLERVELFLPSRRCGNFPTKRRVLTTKSDGATPNFHDNHDKFDGTLIAH
jgi:hypothetical protein